MPLIPGPLAVLGFAAVKAAGYACFAGVLNRRLNASAPVVKFGITKTLLGLVGGILTIVLVSTLVHDSADQIAFIAVIPTRGLVWSLVLLLFYRHDFAGKQRAFGITVLCGIAWSYILDGLMWLIYQLVPGMTIPIC